MWIDERPGLRPKSLQLYRYLLHRHLVPGFSAQTIAGITEADVRRWRADLLTAGVSPVTAVKAYRLLKAILATAADDGLIRRNPCRVKGGGTENSPERPVLSVSQVYALADAVGPRYRALVLLACFCGLRWGELAALRRCDIDIEGGTVRVARQLTEVRGQPPFFAPPKSDAGRRMVVIPSVILPMSFPTWPLLRPTRTPSRSPAPAASHSGTPTSGAGHGCPLWPLLGFLGIHFHDLRHAGNLLVAYAGANLRELMDRMGHSSSRAALIYLHSTDDRQRALAREVARRTRSELGDTGECGTNGHRSRIDDRYRAWLSVL